MIELSDTDILVRLTNTEDSTVERKTASDYRDCLKTAVAFSNSLPVDDPGVVFIGVGNDGTVQQNGNLDSLQRKVSEELSKVYPPIYPQMKVMMKDGKEFLAVIVRGSTNRPHFAGPSFVRDGSRTKEASEEQFKRLIAERNNKAYAILEWKGQMVSLLIVRPDEVSEGTTIRTPPIPGSGRVLECNQFFVTLTCGTLRIRNTYEIASVPLDLVQLSFDHGNSRLQLDILD